MTKAGDPAPDFSLSSTEGDVRLSELLVTGRVLLAFYFEDETQSCSREIATLKDAHEPLKELGVQVVAVSADSMASHRAFAERMGGLPFPLASDTELTAARAFDAVAEDDPRRSRRALFVIDRDGTVAYAANPFQPNSVAQLEEALRAAGVEF